MTFIVYHSTQETDVFVVTDPEHDNKDTVRKLCGEHFESVGEFPEIGERRAAFDESAAKHAIAKFGFFRFHSKTFDPVAQPPGAMPI